MKEAQIKLSVIGDPVITELSYDEGTGLVAFEVAITGVPNGSIALKAADEYLSISLGEKTSITDPFSVILYSESLIFRAFEFQKEYGLLKLYIPVRKIEDKDLEPIIMNL